MRKSWLVIVLLAFSSYLGFASNDQLKPYGQLSAVSFEKTYKSAPLYEVLQDLESHFGLQFLYRPSDIAAAQPITLTIKTNDAHKALQQALGASLQFTTRNGIIIITKAPEKKPAPTRVRSVIIKETPKIIIPDTLPEEEPREVWQAISYLTPGEKLYLSPIDTLRIGEIRIQLPEINHQHSETSHKPSTHNDQQVSYLQPQALPSTKPFNPNKAEVHRSVVSFGFSFGYGSALNGQVDVRYNYYFHRNWGIGGGFYFTGSAEDRANVWQEDVRIGIPVAINTRWPLSPKWGVHGMMGAAPAFKIYGALNKTLYVDIVTIAEVDAMYKFSPRATFLIGLYARVGTLGLKAGDPWATGLHFGFLIGK